MDAKNWALLISMFAFFLSLFSIFKTHIWTSFKFNCRLISFSFEFENGDEFSCESKFFISCSGNQNLYIDKLFINKGDDISFNDKSISMDVQKLLKPGEIEEFICINDAAIFSHDQNYSFIFTLVSAKTDQFHCCLKMTTKEQKNGNLIVFAKKLGSGDFSLNSFSFFKNNKVRQNRVGRKKN